MKKLILLPVVTLLFPLNLNTLNAQWIQQSVPPGTGIVLSIDFQNSNNGCASGWIFGKSYPVGRIIFTTNSGSNWNFSSLPDSARSIVALQHIFSDTYFAAGAYNSSTQVTDGRNKTLPDIIPDHIKNHMQNLGITDGINTGGYFLKSTNGGVSWFPHGTIPQDVEYLLSMDFIDENTGYVTADKGYLFGLILKTTNGGLTWSQQQLPDSTVLYQIDFIDNSFGFAVGFRILNSNLQGAIYSTKNGGDTWNESLYPIINSFWDVTFINNSTGFIAGVYQSGGGSVVYKTDNSGVNWNALTLDLSNFLIQGIRFLPEGNGFVYGEKLDSNNFIEKVFIYKTSDFGNTWRSDSLPIAEIVVGATMLNDNNWYIGGGNPFGYTVLFHTTTGGSVNVEQLCGGIPSDYKLHQNYPNPFNPVTNISFDIQEQGLVTLKIYDILGKEIAILLNETLQSGTYQVAFDATGLTSGVYFYRFDAGGFSETKRMVVLK